MNAEPREHQPATDPFSDHYLNSPFRTTTLLSPPHPPIQQSRTLHSPAHTSIPHSRGPNTNHSLPYTMSHIIFDRSTYQTPDTTPGADRDPIDLESPLVTDLIAHMMPGPGGDAPHLVDVTTDFQMYIDDKAKRGKNKVVWRLIKPEAKSITYGKPAITWTVTIPGVTEFKAPGERLLSEWSFKRWMSALRTGSKTKAMLVLKMPNPSSVQARLATRTFSNVKPYEMRPGWRPRRPPIPIRLAISIPTPGDPNPSDSESDGSDMISPHERTLRSTCPVYLDPLNKRRYIVLSVGNCQEWAQALIDRKPGVSIISPLLPDLSRSDRQTVCRHGQSNRAWHPNPAPLQQEVTAPAQDPASIGDYLDFIGFSHNRQLILDILIANELTFYRIFGTPHMTTTHLITLNISPGVSASLCDNVGRYEQHLAARNH
ncbi:hypothetical protein PSHT_16410 [Puccinia striiformis]|uniref:Uncharacterized protein n=1 Tax=Puccinia striiformis TaxID=27350 RepID=A0A2S4UA11_9BASI|nr:hypothetical protein PSHT_16410 [Puccinia striiformis]